MGLLGKVLSAGQGRQVKKYRAEADRVTAIEDRYEKMTDDELYEEHVAMSKEGTEIAEGGKEADDFRERAFGLFREHTKRVLGKRAYDVQLMAAMALDDGHVAEASTGSGKAVTYDTLCPTPSGFVRAGDVQVGDELFGRDGKPVKVTGRYEQGELDVYRLTLRDGRHIDCCKDHIWSVYPSRNAESLEDHTTEDLLKSGIANDGEAKWFIPLADAAEYETRELGDDPYVVGKFASFGNKRIPYEYKQAGVSQRIALLQGMMDEGGRVAGASADCTGIEYIAPSDGVRDDLMEIACSLGLSCTKRADGFVVSFEIGEAEASILFRKSDAKDAALQAVAGKPSVDRIPIVSIEHLERKEPMVCFTVDADDHLFLVGQYVVTHNTLTSHFATYVNTLRGRKVHVVSVNEYLTKRDADETRRLYEPWGLTVGNIYNQQPMGEKKRAYQCDVVYGTPSEFGFDYLRDNMAPKLDRKVQEGGHQFAIVDEVDSILIDEARTPLIISGPRQMSTELFKKFAAVVPRFIEDVDYIKDESKKIIVPTEEGIDKTEKALGIDNLYSDPSKMYPNYLNNALRAQFLYSRDKDYIVEGGEVKIVDEFTGRVMEGRRWSDGLHQAIEAKEHVKIQSENQTVATVTLQNYFRLYDRLSGMTGTAMTEDAEFRDTYKMGVVQIPDNKPCQRKDRTDVLYCTERAKFNAIVDEIAERHANGQPVLVGTISVENSERLSRMLSKRGIRHNVLNAKNHTAEAAIIAQAGRLGAVTIATNMAGRGTDIMLGGNAEGLADIFLRERYYREDELKHQIPYTEEQISECRAEADAIVAEEHEAVLAAGGLMVIGSERHDSRRIDNQLRGRSGRQGDPGESRFFLSFEDDLMRLFGDERFRRTSAALLAAGYDETVPVESKIFAKAIENAQRTVEGVNAEARKNVLKYDDVMDKQRRAIYGERDAILNEANLDEKTEAIMEDAVRDGVETYCDDTDSPSEWDWNGLRAWYEALTGEEAPEALSPRGSIDVEELEDDVFDALMRLYEDKRSALGKSYMQKVERSHMLLAIDANWQRHLADMDYLKTGIGLRGYSQRDPLTEYKQEAYEMFGSLVSTIYSDYLRALLHYRKAGATSGAEAVGETARDAVRRTLAGAGIDVSARGVREGANTPATSVASGAGSGSGSTDAAKQKEQAPGGEKQEALPDETPIVIDNGGVLDDALFTYQRPHSPTGDIERTVAKAESAGVAVKANKDAVKKDKKKSGKKAK